MKPLIQYNSKCLNAMYDYLQDGQLTAMIDKLTEAENHAISQMDGDRYGESLWFKFSEDDPLATDIEYLYGMFKYGTEQTKEFYKELMAQACKNTTLEVYFS